MFWNIIIMAAAQANRFQLVQTENTLIMA